MSKAEDADSGNEYEGYILDMLEQLAEKAGFTYVIRPVLDNKYGTRMENGRWNGMIGEVVDSVSNRNAVHVSLIWRSLGHRPLRRAYVADHLDAPPRVLYYHVPNMAVKVKQ